MNKSKFLKKSLAAVLAVLMVVAMIPLSAAAADAPKVYVGKEQINFAGGASQSVTVSSAAPSIAWDYPADGSARLYAVDKNGNENWIVDSEGGSGTLTLSDFESPSANVYTVPLLLKEKLSDGGWSDGVSYTLTVTVKESDVDLDASIKEIVNDDTGALDDMVSFSITDNKITIFVPFGVDNDAVLAGLQDENFVPTNDDASAAFTTDEVKVTAPNATMTYTVEVKNQTGFATFSVPTQIGDAEITNDGTAPTITADVNVDTNFDKIIPTFTVGETVERVTTYKGADATGSGGTGDEDDEITVESGKTELKFSDGDDKPFNVYLKGVATPIVVKVTLSAATGNEAVLKSIQVGDKARTTNITGTDVTVAMGVNTNYNDPAGYTVIAEVSTGATTAIMSQGKTGPHSNGFSTLTGVNISGKKFTLRVTSADGKTHTDYNITLVPASEVKTDLTDFTIKKGNDLYVAKFSGTTGTINLPYSAKDNLDSSYKIYATPSAGATAYVNGSTAVQNGTTDATQLGTAVESNNGFIWTYEVRVAADDEALGDTDTTRTYTIKLVFAQPKTGSLVLSGTSAVGTNNVTEINENNTYKTEIGKVKDAGGIEHDAIKITLPHSVYTNAGTTAADIYFNKLNLSPEAKAYAFADTTTTTNTVEAVNVIKQLDEKVLNDQDGINEISMDDDVVGAYNETAKELTLADAYKLYVVNEKTAVTLSTTTIGDLNDACDDNDAKLYYVYAVKAPAETGKSIRSISSTVDKNVSAVLSGGKIVITVPYSYANAHDDPDDLFATEGKHCFTLTSTLSKLATMASASVNITSDYGKEYHSTNNPATRFVVKWSDAAHTSAMIYGSDGTTDALIANTTAGDKEWVVTSEAGGTANTTSYPVTLKVAPAEKGATIKTLKVGNSTASITGTTINLNLPFGASLNPVKLDITADKMAKVFINGTEYKATNNYSLNSDVTITVTSEDTKTTNVYTLKTKVGDRFSDVKSTDWFDEYVQKAVDEGIVKGYDDGTFKPYNDITREEFALMTVRMLDVEAEAEAMKDNALPFKDENKVSSWAKGAVAYCADKKIINGRDTGEFDPAGKITREEAAKILAVALGLDTSDTSASVFTDNARISTWARGYVNACQKRDIFGGDEAKRFNPQARITRAETAKVMVKSLEIK